MKTDNKTITLSLELAKEMIAGENQQLKKLALETYPELGNIMHRILSVQDAIEYLGQKDEDVQTLQAMYTVLREDTPILVDQELIVVIKALNEGKKLDWDNSNIRKYIPWYYLGSYPRFDVVFYCYSSANTSSRLFLDTEPKVKHLVKNFNDKLVIHYNS